MSTVSPEVSVVLPVHNRDVYLRSAIDSVLNQTLHNFELIIVNDGSSNDTCLRIIRDYASRDQRVRIISQENAGLATARNTGIAAARGAHIAFMDDDDISEPTRLEQLLAFLHKHKNIEGVTSLYTNIDTRGHATGYDYPEKDLFQNPIIYSADPDIYKNLFTTDPPRDTHIYRLISKGVPSSRAQVFRTRFGFINLGMFRAPSLKALKLNPLFLTAEDWDHLLRFMERHAIALMPEYLYRYRVYEKHTSSLSSDPLIIHCTMTAFLCALYRSQGKPEPLQESTNVRNLIPLFKELPFPTVAYCLKMLRHQLKRMLLTQRSEQISTLLTDMDKAFLDSEHAAYYAHVRRQALRKLRITALKRGKFLWLLKNSRRLTQTQ